MRAYVAWPRLFIGGVLAVWLLTVAVPARAEQPQQQQAPYVVIVLDDTASMIGQGANPQAKAIWVDVQGAVIRLLGTLPVGAQVLIVPFAGGPEVTRLYPAQPPPGGPGVTWQTLDGTAAVSDAAAFVNQLTANGQSTAIFPSLKFGADQLSAIGTSPQGSGHPLQLYLFTDGIDTSGNPQWLNQATTLLGNLHNDPALHLYSAFINFGPPTPGPCGFDACAETSPTKPLAVAQLKTNSVVFPPLAGRPPRSGADIAVGITVGAAAPPSNEMDVQRSLDQPVGARLRLLAPSALTQKGAESSVRVDAEGDVSLPPGTYTGSLTFAASDMLFIGGNKVQYQVSYAGEATETPTPKPSPTPSATPTATRTHAPTASPTSAPTATPTPRAVETTTPRPVETITPSPSPTPPPPLPCDDPKSPTRCPDPPPWWLWLLVVLAVGMVGGALENFLWRRY